MIPKVIHYCWFGRGEKSRLMKKCIKSWKKYCPDYEIIEWNEDNFDVNGIEFTKGAYKAKKWAFVTDYARLDIIYKHGGIYLDTDVELLKPLDNLLHYKGFFGFQKPDAINTGVGFGAEKGNLLVKQMRDDYNDDVYSEDSETCPVKNTRVLVNNGLVADGTKQEIDGVVFLPKEYLCPGNFANNVLNITENTHSIHHFNASWSKELKEKRRRGICKHIVNTMFDTIIHLPNIILIAILGDSRYEKLKKKLKGK